MLDENLIQSPIRGSLISPDDRMSMQDILSNIKLYLKEIEAKVKADRSQSSENINGLVSNLMCLLGALQQNPDKVDIAKVAYLFGLLQSMVIFHDLQKNTEEIQSLVTKAIAEIKNDSTNSQPSSNSLPVSDYNPENIDKAIAKLNADLVKIQEKNGGGNILSSLMTLWFSEMTQIKYDLSVLYSPNLKDPVVDFNSPSVLVRLSKITGKMEAIHNFVSTVMNKIFTSMNHITRNI